MGDVRNQKGAVLNAQSEDLHIFKLKFYFLFMDFYLVPIFYLVFYLVLGIKIYSIPNALCILKCLYLAWSQ